MKMSTNLDVKLHREVSEGIYEPIKLAVAKSINLTDRQEKEMLEIKDAGGKIQYPEDCIHKR